MHFQCRYIWSTHVILPIVIIYQTQKNPGLKFWPMISLADAFCVLHLIFIRKIVFASELELISLTLCSRPLLSVSNPFSRLKPKLMTGAKEQNCRVAHEVPSKSMGIMLCLAIITRAFCSFMPCLKSQLADRYPTYLKIWDHQGNMPDINQFMYFDIWQVTCATTDIVLCNSSTEWSSSRLAAWHEWWDQVTPLRFINPWLASKAPPGLASGAPAALKGQPISTRMKGKS